MYKDEDDYKDKTSLKARIIIEIIKGAFLIIIAIIGIFQFSINRPAQPDPPSPTKDTIIVSPSPEPVPIADPIPPSPPKYGREPKAPVTKPSDDREPKAPVTKPNDDRLKIEIETEFMASLKRLTENIKAIGSGELSLTEKERQIKTILKQFKDSSSVEVSSLNRKEHQEYSVRDYFYRLMEIKQNKGYDSVSIDFKELKVYDIHFDNRNKKFTSIGQFTQTFRGRVCNLPRFQPGVFCIVRSARTSVALGCETKNDIHAGTAQSYAFSATPPYPKKHASTSPA